MNKDKKWLKVEIKNILRNQVATTSEGSSIYYAIEKKIDELYESEVKQLDKKIKKLDSYNDELIRDNNQLRNALDSQEVLSQEWIGEHAQGGCDEWVYIEDLQNLLVPKQEEVEVQELIEKYSKDFMSTYDVKVEREKFVNDLQNLLVPKQEKPIIPQFVADYIQKHRGKKLNLISRLDFVSEGGFEKKTKEWLYGGSYEENLKHQYLLIDAVRYGYEVEKEKVYYVLDKEDVTLLKKSVTGEGVDKSVGVNINNAKSWKTEKEYQLTEQEIKDYDKRYWVFAEEVTE